MVQFTVKLAGVPIGIYAIYKQTQQKFRKYLTEDAPAFSLTVTETALAREWEITVRHMTIDPGKSYPRNDIGLESQWLYHQIAEHMPDYDALLFHGSAIAVDGEAYLFAAPSGTGKSTHTRLWRQHFGDHAVMINDDKPLLKCENNCVTVYGTPWRGKHCLGSDTSAPLKAICFLARDAENHIASVSAQTAFPELLKHCYRTEMPAHTIKVLTLLERISKNVPLYRMGCNMDPEAVCVAYSGMCSPSRAENGGISQ